MLSSVTSPGQVRPGNNEGITSRKTKVQVELDLKFSLPQVLVAQFSGFLTEKAVEKHFYAV